MRYILVQVKQKTLTLSYGLLQNHKLTLDIAPQKTKEQCVLV